MLIRLTTELDASPDVVWRALQQVETFRYVTRGLMGMTADARWPAEFRVGDVLTGRIWLVHIIPAWTHQVQIVSLDPARHEIYTRENGGLLHNCNHRLRVEPLEARDNWVDTLAQGADTVAQGTDAAPTARCRYTDEFEVRAGRFTPLAAAIIRAFFHYRQMRWRHLARRLAAETR
jgi:hypothetical protein